MDLQCRFLIVKAFVCALLRLPVTLRKNSPDRATEESAPQVDTPYAKP